MEFVVIGELLSSVTISWLRECLGPKYGVWSVENQGSMARLGKT